MSKKPEELTYSRINSFLTCPMREYYEYRVNGTGICSTEPFIPFIVGELLHYALYHYHKSGRMLRDYMLKRVASLIEENTPPEGLEPEVMLKLQAELAAMVGACLAYKTLRANDRLEYEVLYAEEPFQFELEGFLIRGKIDRITRSKNDGKITNWENKSASQVSASNFSALPLSLQDLIYLEGACTILGQYPDLRARDYVIKTKLRRKNSKSGGVETVAAYEARVAQQYIDEPEKMLARPAPIRVYKVELENVRKQLAVILRMFKENEPFMNFSSCTGMYGKPCPYVQACSAKLRGHKDGWDAPECRGMYKLKEVLHPELDKKKEEE